MITSEDIHADPLTLTSRNERVLDRRLGAGPNTSTGTEPSPLDIDLTRMGRTLGAAFVYGWAGLAARA